MISRAVGDTIDVEQPLDPLSRSSHGFQELIETHRQYLCMVASSLVDAKLRGKVDASDLVQDTLVTAHQASQEFSGTSVGELRLWLRRILAHKFANARRRYVQNAKRDVLREVRLGDEEHNYANGLSADWRRTSQTIQQKLELASDVRHTMERLSSEDQELIRLRCWELKPFSEIGQRWEISSDAARKAWCRAIERFRIEWVKVTAVI